MTASVELDTLRPKQQRTIWYYKDHLLRFPMAAEAHVSEILGRYMLKGWTLTDVNCSNSNCRGCPLMRSKTGAEFCARCDGGPVGAAASNSDPAAEPQGRSGSPARRSCETQASEETARTDVSGYETPPTPLLARAGSEGDEEDHLVPIADANVLEGRRLQADMAAHRIGQLLLKGWVLLDGQCAAPNCWGIPLMRTPARVSTPAEGLKRRWCVICQRDWDSDEARAPPPVLPSMSIGNQTVPISAGTMASYLRSHLRNAVPSTALDDPDPAHLSRSTAHVLPPSHLNGPRTVQLVFDHAPKPDATPNQPTNTSHPDLPARAHPDSQVLGLASEAMAEAVRHVSANLAQTVKEPNSQDAIFTAAEYLAKMVSLYKNL